MVPCLLKATGTPEDPTRPCGRRRLLGPLAAFALSAFAPAYVAHAQDIPGAEPPDVAGSRPQLDYDATGLLLGDLRVFPTLGVSNTFDSNVFARPAGLQSDLSITLVPSMRAEWSRSGLQASLAGEVRVRRYLELTQQNDEQYRIEARGSLEVSESTRLSAEAGWTRSTVGRGTFENGLQVGDPLRQERLWAQATAQHRFNRLSFTGRVSVEEFQFDDVVLDDGTIVDQSFRNGRRLGGVLGGAFEIGPRLSIVAQGTLDRYEYQGTQPLFERDASGYTATAGIRYELTRLLVAEVGAGIRKHDFDDPALPDISGLAPNIQVSWYPTALLSLQLDVSRSTSTSAFDSIAAVVVTSARLSADYELLRNLVLTVEADLSTEDYGTGNGTSRLVSSRGQAVWKPNRLLRLTGSVGYDRRFGTSAAFNSEFGALRIMLSAAITR